MPAPSEADFGSRPPVRIGSEPEVADARTRSRVADGRVVGWYGEAGVVIDAELSDRQPPGSLARRHGAERFWERWTAAECRAKIAGVPIMMWLHRHGLDEGPGEVVTRTDVLPGVTLSVARAQPPG